MSDITIGETFARRKLKTIPYGTRRVYAQGQDYAVRLGPNDMLVSWVDPAGGLCIMPCEQVNGEWFHRELVLHCTVDSTDRRVLQRSFALNERMLRSIEIAKTRKVTRRPAGQPGDGS